MTVRQNFDETVRTNGEVLTVTGSSQVLDGADLLSRHVAVQQDDNVVVGAATLALDWATEAPPPARPHPIADRLSAAGFKLGAALAIGTETHFIRRPPKFVTVIWMEKVTIAEQ